MFPRPQEHEKGDLSTALRELVVALAGAADVMADYALQKGAEEQELRFEMASAGREA